MEGDGEPWVSSLFSFHPRSHNKLLDGTSEGDVSFPSQGCGAAEAEKGTATFSSWHFLLGSEGWDNPQDMLGRGT